MLLPIPNSQLEGGFYTIHTLYLLGHLGYSVGECLIVLVTGQWKFISKMFQLFNTVPMPIHDGFLIRSDVCVLRDQMIDNIVRRRNLR